MVQDFVGIFDLGQHHVTTHPVGKKLPNYGCAGVGAVGRSEGIVHPDITEFR